MAQQVNFPRDTTLHEIAEVIRDKYIEFDGTAATYNKIMRQWFISQGANGYPCTAHQALRPLVHYDP